MRRRAPICHGACRPRYGVGRLFVSLEQRSRRRGFTLLEICTVLFIIAIFIGAMMPAMQSVFVEKAVRDDSRQLSLMVKTAMLQSADQNRNYVIDLTSATMTLHPEGNPQASDDETPVADNQDDSDKNTGPKDFVVTSSFDKPNKLLVPDPEKPKGWIDMPPTSWVFKPGELCPASRVRLSRGDAWLEISFNALTGNVENETTYFP